MRSTTIITALDTTAASLAVAGPAAVGTVLVEQARPFSVDAAKGSRLQAGARRSGVAHRDESPSVRVRGGAIRPHGGAAV